MADVVMHTAPWREQNQVAPEDAWILIVYRWEINGIGLHEDCATISNEAGPFLTITLEVPDDFENPDYFERKIAEIRDPLTEDDWLEGTTDDRLILAVRTLVIKERSLEEWAAA